MNSFFMHWLLTLLKLIHFSIHFNLEIKMLKQMIIIIFAYSLVECNYFSKGQFMFCNKTNILVKKQNVELIEDTFIMNNDKIIYYYSKNDVYSTECGIIEGLVDIKTTNVCIKEIYVEFVYLNHKFTAYLQSNGIASNQIQPHEASCNEAITFTSIDGRDTIQKVESGFTFQHQDNPSSSAQKADLVAVFENTRDLINTKFNNQDSKLHDQEVALIEIQKEIDSSHPMLSNLWVLFVLIIAALSSFLKEKLQSLFKKKESSISSFRPPSDTVIHIIDEEAEPEKEKEVNNKREHVVNVNFHGYSGNSNQHSDLKLNENIKASSHPNVTHIQPASHQNIYPSQQNITQHHQQSHLIPRTPQHSIQPLNFIQPVQESHFNSTAPRQQIYTHSSAPEQNSKLVSLQHVHHSSLQPQSSHLHQAYHHLNPTPQVNPVSQQSQYLNTPIQALNQPGHIFPGYAVPTKLAQFSHDSNMLAHTANNLQPHVNSSQQQTHLSGITLQSPHMNASIPVNLQNNQLLNNSQPQSNLTQQQTIGTTVVIQNDKLLGNLDTQQNLTADTQLVFSCNCTNEKNKTDKCTTNKCPCFLAGVKCTEGCSRHKGNFQCKK